MNKLKVMSMLVIFLITLLCPMTFGSEGLIEVLVEGELSEDKRVYHFRGSLEDGLNEKIERVDGVRWAMVSEYEITVYKGRLYKWEEIDSLIISVIEKERGL